MSNLSQMLGLTIHNFLSAATGIAFAFALFRGFARRETNALGNFWADVTRVTPYLLLPISIVYAPFLIANRVPQPLRSSVRTAEGREGKECVGKCSSRWTPHY